MLIAGGALALLAGLPWLVWRGPYVIDEKYLDAKGLADGSAALVTGLRTAVVAAVAALGAGVALLYTARTYRLTRRGQITERFTKALERLGSDHQYVRIGGILGLEQIVRDAPEQAATDAARVLGHFIRDRAPAVAYSTRAQIDEENSISTPPDPKKLPNKPAADVQVALTALTRAESRTHVDPREILDLSGLHLVGAVLNQADFTEANLSEATLESANLSGATLTRANLHEADLVRADLSGATLDGANLSRAKLSAVDLYEAELKEVDLSDASINEANMSDANLSGADLSGAMLDGANLSYSNLSGAKLAMAKLHRARLRQADLSGATLEGANLSEADLEGANLSGATLARADLRGADLSHVRGLPPRLTEAHTDEATILPPEQRPASS
ncbi:pentapeptide repeat-containing protein [Streptomyces cellulosae]